MKPVPSGKIKEAVVWLPSAGESTQSVIDPITIPEVVFWHTFNQPYSFLRSPSKTRDFT